VSESPAADWNDKAAVAEEGELDLTPGMLDKNNDPVRLYLREMGSVPLLKRQDEVAIAKRMERGHSWCLNLFHARHRAEGIDQRWRGASQRRFIDQENYSVRSGRADEEETRIRHTKFFELLGRSNNFTA